MSSSERDLRGVMWYPPCLILGVAALVVLISESVVLSLLVLPLAFLAILAVVIRLWGPSGRLRDPDD